MRGTALRAAIAKLTEYAKDANEKAATADKDLLDLDHELTILQANVSGSCDWRAVVVLCLRAQHRVEHAPRAAALIATHSGRLEAKTCHIAWGCR